MCLKFERMGWRNEIRCAPIVGQGWGYLSAIRVVPVIKTNCFGPRAPPCQSSYPCISYLGRLWCVGGNWSVEPSNFPSSLFSHSRSNQRRRRPRKHVPHFPTTLKWLERLLATRSTRLAQYSQHLC
jgi:hypothetical protein